jgi:hypothetical protein
LNINLTINNENQNCKTATMCAGAGGTSGRRKVEEGDWGDSVWLMDFI